MISNRLVDNKFTRYIYQSFRQLSSNYHFWILIVVTGIIFYMYTAWPWREWQISVIWPWISPLFLQQFALMEVSNYMLGILFYIPILYATLIFTWKGTLITTLVAVWSVSPIISKLWITGSLLTNLTRLLLPLVVVCAISIEVHRRRRERQYLREREEERQAYLAKVLEAQEKERKRIASDLHDDTIQTILTIGRSAETMLSSESNNIEEIRKKAILIRDMSFDTVDNLRAICLDLRPSVLDNLGLSSALRWLVNQVNKESNVSIQISVTGIELNIPPQTELILFRIVQEALSNVTRHSLASSALVNLNYSDSNLEISIKDNGTGFHIVKRIEEFSSHGKMGLVGMKQRSELIKAKFNLYSVEGKGTTVSISVKC
jgi:signal transduction histidine kinase